MAKEESPLPPSAYERMRAAREHIANVTTKPPVMLTDTIGYISVGVTLTDGRFANGIEHFDLRDYYDSQKSGTHAGSRPLTYARLLAIGQALEALGFLLDVKEAT